MKSHFVIIYVIDSKILFSYQQKAQGQAFNSLMESLSSGVTRFCHMIKLIKYHVTKRPGRSPRFNVGTWK